MPAAISPKATCRKPEYNAPRPVSSVIPTPIPNKANADKTALTTSPSIPDMKKNGATGIIAPSANRKNEAPAAPHAEPPNSSGLIPNSSRAIVSRAADLSFPCPRDPIWSPEFQAIILVSGRGTGRYNSAPNDGALITARQKWKGKFSRESDGKFHGGGPIFVRRALKDAGFHVERVDKRTMWVPVEIVLAVKSAVRL